MANRGETSHRASERASNGFQFVNLLYLRLAAARGRTSCPPSWTTSISSWWWEESGSVGLVRRLLAGAVDGYLMASRMGGPVVKPSAVKETSQATPLLSAGRSQPSMAREETRGVTRMGPARAYYAVIWVQKVVEQRPCRPAFEYLGPFSLPKLPGRSRAVLPRRLARQANRSAGRAPPKQAHFDFIANVLSNLQTAAQLRCLPPTLTKRTSSGISLPPL